MNIAICDIDKEFASIIKLKIEEKLGSVDVDIYTDSKLLMQSDKVYDCVFLYMDMPDINGIDMARCIREKYTFTKMIFILSKLDAVVEVMKYNPYRFIRKEHLEEDIKEVIAVLKEKSEEERQVVCDILRLDSSNLRLIQYAFIRQHSIGSGVVRLFLSKVRLIVAKRRRSVFMSEIIDRFYTPLLIEHGFIRDPDNQQYGALGDCWKLSPEVGEGTYWTYGQKDLYDIKIHNFSFHEDFMLECSMPECLSITRYDSISGEELSPYRRLSAGCIKTFIGGYAPYKALIHKNIPIRSVGIEIAPAYYEDYLKKLYPEAQINPVDAFRKIDQTSDFPEMSRLLTEIKDYRGEGIAAKLFYEGKVAEAVSMVVEYQKKHPDKPAHKLSQQDIENLQIVAAYLSDHYAFDIPLDRLTQIACMGTTKLKSCFKKYYDCTITEYVQQRRMSQAEYLLAYTELTVGQVAQTVGYSTSSRFAELFRKSTGLLPLEYRKNAQRK